MTEIIIFQTVSYNYIYHNTALMFKNINVVREIFIFCLSAYGYMKIIKTN
jgi:hypothetical protein